MIAGTKQDDQEQNRHTSNQQTLVFADSFGEDFRTTAKEDVTPALLLSLR